MKLIGLMIILGIGFFIYSMRAQTRDVAELCSTHPVGTPVANIWAIADRYSGQLMGPFESADKTETQRFIYCAPVTMCDVSCSLEIKDGVVTKSQYSSL